jgi:DNA-binding SARP family transcriptional activator/predicted ATPase
MPKRRASALSLCLLGSPRLELDGQPVTVDTRKAIALLAYLAVTRQPHSREALAALLWPDYDQSHAFAALRRTLSALNGASGGYGLAIERESIGLDDQADIWIDVEQFQNRLAECRTHGHADSEVCARCLEPLTQAVDLYREDFLAGFSLRDSAAFDDWQFFQAESLRREFLGVLDRLVRLHEARGEFKAAIEQARRYLSIDPLHEPAQQALMRLYAQTGQRSAALRQYEECVRILKTELGVAPLAETLELFEAIKANRLFTAEKPRVPAGSDQPSAVSHAYPLVGRERELQTVLRLYDRITADGHFVAIEGEAGIGKTRLVEEFLAQVQPRGAIVIAARGYAGELNVAYAPISEALRGVLARPPATDRLSHLPAIWLSEAARLLPELSAPQQAVPAPPALTEASARARFFEGIAQTLLILCGRSAPGIFFLDDAHYADEASLDLLAYLVRRLRGRPLSIIAAWRDADTPPDHRLRQMLAEAQHVNLGTALTLSPLNAAHVAQLVQAAHLSQNLGEALYRESEGVPLFVVEYLQAWHDPQRIDSALPHGVRELLRTRLTGVDEVGRQLLQTAAIIGRSFDLDTVREVSGRGEEETINAIEHLRQQRLIRETPRAELPAYDFAHDKLRAYIYDEIGLARRRLLHQRVAQALIARGRKQRDLRSLSAQIALHWQAAGQLAEASEYFYLAGGQAQLVYAHAEALAHYHAALAAGHADPALLHETSGDVHTLRGEYRSALGSYETAATLVISDQERLGRLEHKIGAVYQRQGEYDLAEQHLVAAQTAWGDTGGRAALARLYIDRALVAHQRGNTDRAQALAEQALALAELVAEPMALAQAHNLLGVLARRRGDLTAAERQFQHSLKLAQACHDQVAQVAALNNLALVHEEEEKIDRALELTAQALALCTTYGDRHRAAALHNHLADLLHAANRSDEAMMHLKQAVTIFAEIGVEAGALQPEIWKLTEW